MCSVGLAAQSQCEQTLVARMNCKCQAEECSFCLSKFLGNRHRYTEGWSSSMVDFVEEESGLVLPNYVLKVNFCPNIECLVTREPLDGKTLF